MTKYSHMDLNTVYLELQIHVQSPRERADTKLPRPPLKAKVSPTEWTVWTGNWENYSTFSRMEEPGLAVQLWH